MLMKLYTRPVSWFMGGSAKKNDRSLRGRNFFAVPTPYVIRGDLKIIINLRGDKVL